MAPALAGRSGDYPPRELGPSLEMLQWMMARAPEDHEARSLLIEIQQLLKPLSALMHPPWPERMAAQSAEF